MVHHDTIQTSKIKDLYKVCATDAVHVGILKMHNFNIIFFKEVKFYLVLRGMRRLSFFIEKNHNYFMNRFVCVGEFFDG